MVLHLGDEHAVSRPHIRAPPGVGDEVDRLGRVADEDGAARFRADQPRHRGAPALVEALGILIITHYQRILHLVEPDFVHVMYDGRIVKEGGPELVGLLEERGYGWIREEVEALSPSGASE